MGWRTSYRPEAQGVSCERQGDPLCKFVRSLDYRHRDTWIIRAVFEELQRYLSTSANHGAFPIMPSDRITDDLCVDEDDLDLCIAPRVAKRCGRTLDHYEDNPFYGRVHTVQDLMDFFEAQPRVESPHLSA